MDHQPILFVRAESHGRASDRVITFHAITDAVSVRSSRLGALASPIGPDFAPRRTKRAETRRRPHGARVVPRLPAGEIRRRADRWEWKSGIVFGAASSNG